jgi:hypothetical protein
LARAASRTVFIAAVVDGKRRVHIVDLHLITRFDVEVGDAGGDTVQQDSQSN